ncbi:hypothetical protein DFH28DRAFT_888926 [Melampsora americana]|nr:hypothetical protein DFH28DRAFT_888926 [Melampsora americana]
MIELKDLIKTWFIISSTFSMWKGKKNVKIRYSILKDDESNLILNDQVEYQSKGNDQKKRLIKGIDEPMNENQLIEWNWNGKGILSIFKTNWNILFYTSFLIQTDDDDHLIVYFDSTLFTSNGLDLLCNRSDGLSDSLKQKIILVS